MAKMRTDSHATRKEPQGGDAASAFKIGAFFLVGLFMVLSLPLVSSNAQSVRFLDLLGVVSLVYVLKWAIKTRLSIKVWLLVWLSGIGLLLVLTDSIHTGDSGRTNIIIRLVLSVATGICLAQLATKHDQIKPLALGAWCGSIAACLIAFGQSLGIGEMISMAPADRVESAIQGIVRPAGIWGHPNTAGQVTMAGAAIILLAWNKRHNVFLLPLAMYMAVPFLNYSIMQNRAPLLVGLLICSLATLRHANIQLRLAAALCLLSVISVLISEPSALISERWTSTFSGMSTSEQVTERLGSTIAGLAISFDAPLGHSSLEREARMLSETGTRASHNGFVHAFLVLGPFLAAWLIGLLVLALRPQFGSAFPRSYMLASGSLAVMLLFEDSIFEPTVTTLLTLIASLACIDKLDKENVVKDQTQIDHTSVANSFGNKRSCHKEAVKVHARF